MKKNSPQWARWSAPLWQALPVVWLCRDFLFAGKRLLSIEVLDMSYGWARRLEQVGWDLRSALWDPNSFCGIPFLANPATRSLYPPDVFLRLVAHIQAEWLFSWLILSHYLVLGGGAYLWLRSCGRSRAAAHLGGWLWTASGFLSVRTGLADPGFLLSVAWFPWILFVLNRIERPLAGPLLILFGLLEVLAGRPDMTFYLAYLCLGLLVWRWAPRLADRCGRRRTLKAAAVGSYSAITLLLLTGLQLWATFDLQSSSSQRSGEADFEFAATDSLYPPQILLTLVPGGLSDPHEPGGFERLTNRWLAQDRGSGYHEVYFYLGQITWVLVLAGVCLGTGRTRWFWLLATLFSLALALGKFSPLFSLFFEWVPGWSRFRVPPRVLVVLLPAVSFLAAQGFDRLLLSSKETQKNRVWVGGVLALVVLFGLLAMATRPLLETSFCSQEYLQKMGIPVGKIDTVQREVFRDFREGLLRSLFVLLLPAALLWLGGRKILPTRLLRYTLPVCLLVDLCWINGGYLRGLSRYEFEDAFPVDPLIEAYRENDGAGRLLVLGSAQNYRARAVHPWFFPGRLYAYDVPSANGYGPFLLKNYVDTFQKIAPTETGFNQGILLYLFFLDQIDPLAFRYFHATRIIGPQPPFGDFEQVEEKSYGGKLGVESKLYLLRDSQAYPPAFLVAPEAEGTFPPPDPTLGEVRLETEQATRKTYRVEAAGAARMVCLDTWYPGWRCRIDSQEATLEPFGGCFRAIEIGPGSHTVEVSFEPRYWRWGCRLLILGGCLWGISILAAGRKSLSRRAPTRESA